MVDPLLVPVGAVNAAGRQVAELLQRLKSELKVNSTCAASNVGAGRARGRRHDGHDPDCVQWMRTYRDPGQVAAEAAATNGRRRGGRSRRG